MLLAHISDVHMGPLTGFSLRHWNLKRGLGYLNWHRGRKTVHVAEALDRLVADMQRTGPDHIAVTGDLANLGLPGEYLAAKTWLQTLGPPSRVTVVPGNHDIYVHSDREPGVQRWQAYMEPDEFGRRFADPDGAAFPFVRRLGPAALIGLNSAVPTPPFIAGGRLGKAQIARLADILDSVADLGLLRVVLIHHPPLPDQTSPRRALKDARRLTQVLVEHGAELVLHGHNHKDTLVERETKTGRMLVFGIASGSAGRIERNAPLARYNLFRFNDFGERIEIQFSARGYSEPGGPVVELARRALEFELPNRRAKQVNRPQL